MKNALEEVTKQDVLGCFSHQRSFDVLELGTWNCSRTEGVV